MTRVPRTNLQVAQAWCVVRETVASQWSAKNVAVIVGGTSGLDVAPYVILLDRPYTSA